MSTFLLNSGGNFVCRSSFASTVLPILWNHETFVNKAKTLKRTIARGWKSARALGCRGVEHGSFRHRLRLTLASEKGFSVAAPQFGCSNITYTLSGGKGFTNMIDFYFLIQLLAQILYVSYEQLAPIPPTTDKTTRPHTPPTTMGFSSFPPQYTDRRGSF